MAFVSVDCRNIQDLKMHDIDLRYIESTEEFANPDRGFYQPLSYQLGDPKPWWFNQDTITNYYAGTENFGLFHLRFGLEKYSTNAGGTDNNISQINLNDLTKLLQFIRNSRANAIVRFSYDLDGTYGNKEPGINLIVKHIQQLGNIINQYEDVVCMVESGMFGPWGEQHSTTLSQNNSAYYTLVESWLTAVPHRSINVRRPRYFRFWANQKYGINLTANNMDNYIAAAGSDAFRVGIYNDGYLGSETDLGTFDNRVVEVAWLKNHGAHTFYGGEVAADSNTGLMGNYNNLNFI
jgi:hypothetical protein